MKYLRERIYHYEEECNTQSNKNKGIILGTLGRGRIIPSGRKIIRNWGCEADFLLSFYVSRKDIIRGKYPLSYIQAREL